MNKAVKVSMIGIGIVAGLFIVALIVFVSTFNLNDYKNRITKSVRDETGRTLNFDGDLTLKVFPRLGVELGGVSLSNAEGFGEKPMIQSRNAQVYVQILPLFKGEVKFGHMELSGLTLNLSRNVGGVTNWHDLVGREEADEMKAASQPKEDKFSLEIEGITITNANLMWDDRMTDTTFILRGANLKTGQIYRGAPFPVEANLEFECTKPNAKGSLSLSGKSSIDFANRQYGHMDMKFLVTAEGADIPGGKGTAEMGLQFLVLDFNKEHAQVTGFTASSYGATAHFDGSFEGITNGLQKMAATLTLDPFDAKKTLVAVGEEVPDTADADALTKVGGMVDFIITPGQLHVKTLQADIDGTRIVGSGRVKRGDNEPFYFARLDVGDLDLDRYLPPEHKENTAVAMETARTGQKDDILLPTSVLRRLFLDLEVKVANFKIEGMRMQNVKAEMKARHGLVRVSPVSADSYGGTISGGATINAINKYPKTDLIFGANSVDIGALSKDVLGDASYAGVADVHAAISCDGTRVPSMLRSMNGKVSFSLENGVFPGVDLIKMAEKTHKQQSQKTGKVEAVEADKTKFGSISGTGIISGGILRNNDLEVKAPGLRADGHGAVVLPTKQIDYMLKVKLTPTAQGQGGKSSGDLYGVMVPIHVSGTLDDPQYWVSISEYIKALGGVVIGTAGSVLGGVKDAIMGVGAAIDESCCEESPTTTEAPQKRKRFLGIF